MFFSMAPHQMTVKRHRLRPHQFRILFETFAKPGGLFSLRQCSGPARIGPGEDLGVVVVLNLLRVGSFCRVVELQSQFVGDTFVFEGVFLGVVGVTACRFGVREGNRGFGGDGHEDLRALHFVDSFVHGEARLAVAHLVRVVLPRLPEGEVLLEVGNMDLKAFVGDLRVDYLGRSFLSSASFVDGPVTADH